MGRPGWSILDSVGIFAEPEETETGRLYGQVNYARFDQFIDPNFVPAIEPGTDFQKIPFEIEYMGRWGNSTGHDVGDWHISNFTDKVGLGIDRRVSDRAMPDWRQSCIEWPRLPRGERQQSGNTRLRSRRVAPSRARRCPTGPS